MSEIRIMEWLPHELPGPSLEQDLDALAEVLHASVHAGASVSFILPFSIDDARSFWVEKVLPGALAGTRRVLVARRGTAIVGTVQLDLAVPPNQVHRAEVLKLLVHPGARRCGIGRGLMAEIERVAGTHGRTLLTLDTRHRDAAEPLYTSMGYVLAGVIPRYARGPHSPELEAASFMYKDLAAG